MAVKFTEEDHRYVSVDPSDIIEWTSVTTFVNMFKNPFDAEAISERVSKKKGSKWYKMEPEEIRRIWKEETNRALGLGTWYHNQREAELLAHDFIGREAKDGSIIDVPIIRPIINDKGEKFAPEQKLMQGIYPEHLVYLRSAGLAGQADRIEVIEDQIHVYDYKTNKEIKTESYKNWEGISKKMLGPCAHLDDCNYNHYALQLSLYMYMMLKHNHFLNPGKIQIHHITFEIEAEDEYGNPITKRDDEGNPIVAEVIPYEMDYMKSEVVNMIKHFKKTQAENE